MVDVGEGCGEGISHSAVTVFQQLLGETAELLHTALLLLQLLLKTLT